MNLSSGHRLGPFEIVGPLGAGGMGEVYRARDTRLDRIVALKLLPAAFAANRERLVRFEQEARAASALNHPNIVTIYELGHDGSSHFIAMELVIGKTLREMIESGPLPMRKLTEIASQIAEGLSKAHEAGITHRDLKPENVMISEEGLVKVLDFGLAKIKARPDQVDTGMTIDGTTSTGVLVGTIGYMSPEQVAGGHLDFRSDQFSFGLMLYEMVAGKRPFQRATAAEVMVGILREQAEPVGAQNREAPAPLCWAIERCLAKEPEKRYASTRELARELSAIRERLSERPAAAPEAVLVDLPVSRSGFVGREKEIAATRELLLRPDVRLITITGPGGIGKTRLAIEVAGGLAELFPGGIRFVPLSPITDPGLVPSAITQVLGIREVGAQSPLDLLKKFLRDSLTVPSLFLLDNFEQVAQAASVVAELLAAAPNLKILVTSRSALHIYGEHEFLVAPLALPDARSTSSASSLLQYPAVALFVQRAAAAKPGFELNRENAAAVIELCSRLDGLPLAIELAAARVKILSPSSMLPRLSSRLQLLTGGARDLPQRQQTLRAAMDWSFDLLSAAEQKLFFRLSAFVGGCNLEGVEAVCDTRGDLGLDLLDGMSSLVDKSLVQHNDHASGEPRFTMLEIVREYATEKLQGSGEYDATRRAHAAFCLILAEEVAADDSGAGSPDWLDRFSTEHNNFRAALDWLIESGDAAWGLRLSTALFRFWELREFFAEGRDRLGAVLGLAGAAPPTRARARALFAAGVLAGEQGDYASATSLMGESQHIARHLGDNTGLAVSLNAMAVHARDRGDLDFAHNLFEQSLELWRDIGDLKAVARALSNLANILQLQGEFDRARALHAESLSIFRGLRDLTGVAWALNYQGDAARDQGDSCAAEVLYEQSLAMFRELEDRWGVAGTLADLGNLAREQCKFAEASALYCESIGMFQGLGHKRGIARLLECFACSAAAQQQSERALRLAGAAAALRHNIGAPITPAEQSKLESSLEPVRRSLPNNLGTNVWLEGWGLTMESAIEEATRPASIS